MTLPIYTYGLSYKQDIAKNAGSRVADIIEIM